MSSAFGFGSDGLKPSNRPILLGPTCVCCCCLLWLRQRLGKTFERAQKSGSLKTINKRAIYAALISRFASHGPSTRKNSFVHFLRISLAISWLRLCASQCPCVQQLQQQLQLTEKTEKPTKKRS